MTCLVLSATTASAQQNPFIAPLFKEHMVLQRDIKAPVWGWTKPGTKVTVEIAGQSSSAEADATGRWEVKIGPLEAGGPHTLKISGPQTVTVKDVLVGDVWLCGGQSNMEWVLAGSDAADDIKEASFPKIRHTRTGGNWTPAESKAVGTFSGVAFYFARAIHKETGVPIGLINNSIGGTRIEPWVPSATKKDYPEAKFGGNDAQLMEQYRKALKGGKLDELEAWLKAARKALDDNAEVPPQPAMPPRPASMSDPLFAGHTKPLIPYAIKGMIWYQGESNGNEGEEYYHKMRALIGSYRKLWGEGDFPFYFVQLPNFQGATDKPEGGDGWARIRMAQLKAMGIVNTGMAITLDVGDAKDIHPHNKKDVGERLARWALAKDYGKKDLVYSGPIFKSMKEEDGKLRLTFDHVGGGLMVGKKDGKKPVEEVKDGKLKRFAIAGEDKKWQWAEAVIDGKDVVVSSPMVKKPVAVRYGYSGNPEGANLYNKEGLPASPFRTDDW
jgi:sialate O-acetylesterase